MIAKRNRVIGIVSGKGGVGKTVTAVNLSALLARGKNKTLVIDSDLQNPNVGIHVGFASVQLGLQDVLADKARLGDAVLLHPQSGLRVLPASLKPSYEVRVQNLRKVLHDASVFDFVFVDSPPSILEFVQEVIRACDEIIVVTTPDLPSVTSANKVIAFAEKNGVRIIGIVLNRVRNKSFELHPKEIEEVTRYKILVSIPESDVVPLSVSLQEPVVLRFPDSVVARRFAQLAEIVAGKPLEAPRRSFLAAVAAFLRGLNPFQ